VSDTISGAKVFPCSGSPHKVEPKGFVKNLPLSLWASVFIPENLAWSEHGLVLPPKLDNSDGSEQHDD
jgi:hypothetical protein